MTPAQAPESGVSRSEMRRRSATEAIDRPAVVWGRETAAAPAPAAPAREESAPTLAMPVAPERIEPVAPVDITPKSAVDAPTPAVDAPRPAGPSRRARRAVPGAQPQVPPPALDEVEHPLSAPIELPGIDIAVPAPVSAVEPEPAPASTQPAAEAVPAEPVLDEVADNAAPADPLAPLRSAPAAGRRARRARERADEPVVLPDTVLAPAEPFELIEPVVEAQPEIPAVAVETEIVPAPEDRPSAGASSARRRSAPRPVEQPDEDPRAEFDSWVDTPRSSAHESSSSASDRDEFAAAAALFAFTGETPVQDSAKTEAPAEPAPAPEASAAFAKPRRARTRTSLRRIAATGFSVGVMGVVGILTVGMTTPVEAVALSSGATQSVSVLAATDTEAGIAEDEIQAYVAPADTENADLTRDETYDTITTAELAAESGISNFSSFFVNDPNSAIQWPFAVGVPISYGFGMRSGRMHEGVDFVPGYGAPIQAIADGTVRVATSAGGAYGVHVIIDHEIDGQLVSSHYAHMIYGSIAVVPGQHVTVGTVLGRTGNTGRSYGAHTHFEILMNGTTAIDPIPWLREHAGG